MLYLNTNRNIKTYLDPTLSSFHATHDFIQAGYFGQMSRLEAAGFLVVLVVLSTGCQQVLTRSQFTECTFRGFAVLTINMQLVLLEIPEDGLTRTLCSDWFKIILFTIGSGKSPLIDPLAKKLIQKQKHYTAQLELYTQNRCKVVRSIQVRSCSDFSSNSCLIHTENN